MANFDHLRSSEIDQFPLNSDDDYFSAEMYNNSIEIVERDVENSNSGLEEDEAN